MLILQMICITDHQKLDFYRLLLQFLMKMLVLRSKLKLIPTHVSLNCFQVMKAYLQSIYIAASLTTTPSTDSKRILEVFIDEDPLSTKKIKILQHGKWKTFHRAV